MTDRDKAGSVSRQGAALDADSDPVPAGESDPLRAPRGDGRGPRTIAMRERFIEVTTELLRIHGLGGVSSRMICDAVGVKSPTLYHHFGDLESLHGAVVDHAFMRYFESSGARPTTDDPFQRVRDGWDMFVAFSISEPKLYIIIAQQNVSGTLPAPIVRALRDLVQQMREIAEVRPLRYAPEVAADMFAAACLGAASFLAARRNGLPGAGDVSAVLREAVFGSLLI